MNTVKKIPVGYHSITPYLSLVDAASAIKFYQQAFGAKVIGQISMPDGKVGHAELQIGDSKLMLAEEMPMWGNKSPATLGGSGVDIALYVNDVDATVARALEVGATVVEPVKDEFYGDRRGMLTDPYGHRWHILTHIEDVSFVEMQKRSDAMFAAKR